MSGWIDRALRGRSRAPRGRPCEEDVAALMESFRYNGRLRRDLLAALDDRRLGAPWVEGSSHTFTRHFLLIAGVQVELTWALHRGRLDFDALPAMAELPGAAGRAHVAHQLARADALLEEAVRRVPMATRRVDWGGRFTVTAAAHLSNLIGHELLRHGVMAGAMLQLGLPLPPSWGDAWDLWR